MNDLTADLARALFRAERAEQDRDYLLRVVARLEGHNDDDLARLRHLPPEGNDCERKDLHTVRRDQATG